MTEVAGTRQRLAGLRLRSPNKAALLRATWW
jgi:hypothetical protein